MFGNPNSKVHGTNMGPPGSCHPQMGPMLAPRTLLSGKLYGLCSTVTSCGQFRVKMVVADGLVATWYQYICKHHNNVFPRPVSLTIFARNSNSMETSPCCKSVAGHEIATNVCTCHDSTAVVARTKFCSDPCHRIEVRVKQNFPRIWIAMEKTLVKRGAQSVYLKSPPT